MVGRAYLVEYAVSLYNPFHTGRLNCRPASAICGGRVCGPRPFRVIPILHKQVYKRFGKTQDRPKLKKHLRTGGRCPEIRLVVALQAEGDSY